MVIAEKMAFGMRLRSARKALRITREAVANKMGCSAMSISNYESAINPLSDKILASLKKAMGVEDIPYTDSEILEYKKNLYSMNASVNNSDISLLDELIHKLSRCSKLCFDEDLQNLCDLLCAGYTLSVSKMRLHGELMDSLHERTHTFTDEHFHWYYRCLGLIEQSAWRYKTAMSMYRKAEEYGNRVASDFNLNMKSLYYSIGFCLTEMNYSYLAMGYLEKLQTKDFSSFNLGAGISIQKLILVNLSKLGESGKALEQLKNCLVYVLRDKNHDKLTLFELQMAIGSVYEAMDDFDMALEYYDNASTYDDVNNGTFIEYLCYKATLLRTHNHYAKVWECLNQGLPTAIKGTLWYEWLTAIKHSMTLEDSASVNSLEWTSIPKLLEHGKHLLVVNCYDWISSYYEQDSKYKLALKYDKMAAKIYKQLINGDLSL